MKNISNKYQHVKLNFVRILFSHIFPNEVTHLFNCFLFIITCILWGATWLAIHYQVSSVPKLWSITYRFAVAGLLLWVFCLISKRWVSFTSRQHFLIALQGILLFALNFMFVYNSTQYLISGLVAVIFSSILILNMINAHLFFKTPVSLQFVIGALMGICGLALVFSADIYNSIQHHLNIKEQFLGLFLCLAGTLCASLGNMVVSQIKDQVPLLPSTALSMLYGALFTAVAALCTQTPLSFDWRPAYLISLAYLIFGGSIIGFVSYMTLIRKQGPARAAYVFVFTPIVAMLLSAWVEHFTWTVNVYLGLLMIVISQCLVLGKNYRNLWQQVKSFALDRMKTQKMKQASNVTLP